MLASILFGMKEVKFDMLCFDLIRRSSKLIGPLEVEMREEGKRNANNAMEVL